jgi:hypothetical protein
MRGKRKPNPFWMTGNRREANRHRYLDAPSAQVFARNLAETPW